MLSIASQIARDAGDFLRNHFGKVQQVKKAETHDIKLQIDVDCQRLIETQLLKAFPKHSIIGEEESYGDSQVEYRWVVDPLDGTVNYNHGIPHFAVSIALQQSNPKAKSASIFGGYELQLGVVYDPMRDELFTTEKGKGTYLNGHPIFVSQRSRIEEAILALGFSKSEESIQRGLPHFQRLIRTARKLRMMGSAALDLAYIACGRLEAYSEFKVQLWDIAAGILMVEEAGGRVELEQAPDQPHSFKILASNGKVDLGIS